jgi:hypothetical protein
VTLKEWTGGYRGALCATAALFAASYAWLRQAPLLVPYQGVHSILAARSLNEGRGFEVVPGIPFAKFGPFYPLALSLLGRLGLNVTAAAYLINCAALAGAMLGLYALFRLLGLSRIPLAIGLYGLLAANVYLLRSARPDLVVVCAATLALVAMVHYTRERSQAALLVAALCCSVAATSRYMAVLSLLPMILVALWLGGGSLWVRLRNLAIFGFVGAGPVLLWLLRNRQLTGFVTGMSRTRPRRFAGGDHAFAEQFQGMLATIWIDGFSPQRIGLRQFVYREVELEYLGWMIATAAIAVLGVAGVVWLRRQPLKAHFVHEARTRSSAHAASLLTAGYILLYTAVLLVVWTTTNNDPIHTRYVSPMYGYVIGLLALVFSVAGSGDGQRSTRWVALLVFVLIAVPNLPRTVRLMAHDPPRGKLVFARSVGDRGHNWMEPLEWDDLDRIRPARAGPVSGEDD